MSVESNGINGGRLQPQPVTVLIQDPHALVRGCLRVLVEQTIGARVVAEAGTPDEALEAARLMHPDIVFIDLAGSSSVAVVSAISSDVEGSRVICLADEVSDGAIEAALEAGATAFALKSDSVEDLMRALDQVRRGRASIAPNATGPFIQHYMQIIQEKHQRDTAIIDALASAIEAKDSYSGGHTHRVARLAAKIAQAHDPGLGANAVLRYGFTLHDVGKIGVPEDILLKKGPLTEREWEVMRTHPMIGLHIIHPAKFGDDVEGIVLHHHERWDGNGYPKGLKSEDIPLPARLFSVADAYDAMTSDRPYRNGIPSKKAIEEIVSESGKQFDPAAVKTFLSIAS